jgi:hypothetical protein
MNGQIKTETGSRQIKNIFSIPGARADVRSILAVYKAPEISIYAIYPATRELSVKVRLMITFWSSGSAAGPIWI